MRIFYLFVFLVSSFLTSCKTEEDLGFAPAADPKATYSFTITDAARTTAWVYNLTGISQQASVRTSSGDTEFYTFMLKGKDKVTQQDVYITGNTNPNDAYLNIAIGNGASVTFYKDCNNFNCQVTIGSDSRGKYVKLTNFSSQCVTTTLASERSMTIVQYNAQLNPLTFYLQE